MGEAIYVHLPESSVSVSVKATIDAPPTQVEPSLVPKHT